MNKKTHFVPKKENHSPMEETISVVTPKDKEPEGKYKSDDTSGSQSQQTKPLNDVERFMLVDVENSRDKTADTNSQQQRANQSWGEVNPDKISGNSQVTPADNIPPKTENEIEEILKEIMKWTCFLPLPKTNILFGAFTKENFEELIKQAISLALELGKSQALAEVERLKKDVDDAYFTGIRDTENKLQQQLADVKQKVFDEINYHKNMVLDNYFLYGTEKMPVEETLKRFEELLTKLKQEKKE